MVNVTSEESFADKTVIVAEETGCLLMVSKAIPLTVPFFWENTSKEQLVRKSSKKNFLMAD